MATGEGDGTDGFGKLIKRMCGCSEDKPKLPETSKRPVYDEVDYDMFSPNYRYEMKREKRGEFIIINNENFTAEGCDKRPGTDVDAGHLKEDFEMLGFNVTSHKDLTAIKMKRAVEEAVKKISESQEDLDSFGLAVLSHGDADDIVYGTDDKIRIKNLIEPIKKCPKLIGKPKIFIIQACRGDQLDDGVVIFGGGDSGPARQSLRIPLEADCLYVYSTVQGYFAWRNNTDGSWFIQALHGMIQYCFRKPSIKEIEFIQLLTRVNYQVAHDFESSARKKQVPSIVSMLTKDLVFPIPR